MQRPVAVAVEVDFAPEVEAALRDLWRGLRADGHPTPEGSGPPHVSLAVGTGIVSEHHAAELESAVRTSFEDAPTELVLDGVGAFPGPERVVYLSPQATQALLEWHRALWPAAERALIDPVHYYAPGNWVPHCTMRWGPGPPAEETIAWLEQHAHLPLTTPLAAVALRVYRDGRMEHQRWSAAIPQKR